jgi:hypothetical protein
MMGGGHGMGNLAAVGGAAVNIMGGNNLRALYAGAQKLEEEDEEDEDEI